jgi:heterodisulfide reductase subunit B
MKYYSYFPGCSASDGVARAYGWSARAVSKALDVELVELEDWNCCGSTAYPSVDELGAFCVAARNLALAEKKGLDLVTPCSSCYVILNRTSVYFSRYPELRTKISAALAAGGLEYHGTVKVRHLLDIFVRDVGFEALKSRVVRNLTNLKVAAYYGCQVVRPTQGLDHPEYPEMMDKLVASLGAEPVAFPLKSYCCGGSLVISEEKLTLELMKKVLSSASSNGAECLVTACPLCQTNLDAYQNSVNKLHKRDSGLPKLYKSDFRLPVLFFTQLMGLAFGLNADELGLKTNIVPANNVLAHVQARETTQTEAKP